MIYIGRLLVEEGKADTRARAKVHHQPLHVACLENRGEIVRFLLTKGKADVEAPDKNGKRCLHLALERNKLDAIRELLKYGYECCPLCLLPSIYRGLDANIECLAD